MRKRGRKKLADFKNFIPKYKHSQEVFGLSFGTIFAIILAIFFIILAIIVINSLLNMQNCSKIGIFLKELNTNINNAWNSNDASFEFSGFLPSSIQYICFADLSRNFNIENSKLFNSFKTFNKKNNFFFYPEKKACNLPSHEIKNIDISEITNSENPLCIRVINGKVGIIIEKENNKPLVIIKRK